MSGVEGPVLRVFLSHTAELGRLPAGGSFIEAVEGAVRQAGHIPVDMADWTASPNPPAQVCRDRVERADVYVGVLGFRYGSPVREHPEVSYTELEFDTARAAGKPLLVFGVVEWSFSIDSSSIRAHQHAAGARKKGAAAPPSRPSPSTGNTSDAPEAD